MPFMVLLYSHLQNHCFLFLNFSKPKSIHNIFIVSWTSDHISWHNQICLNYMYRNSFKYSNLSNIFLWQSIFSKKIQCLYPYQLGCFLNTHNIIVEQQLA